MMGRLGLLLWVVTVEQLKGDDCLVESTVVGQMPVTMMKSLQSHERQLCALTQVICLAVMPQLLGKCGFADVARHVGALMVGEIHVFQGEWG